MLIVDPYLYSSGGMKGEGEARAGVGEGSSVSVPVLSWEAVMRPLEAVVGGVRSDKPLHIKKISKKSSRNMRRTSEVNITTSTTCFI
jgi:hypothetical protein